MTQVASLSDASHDSEKGHNSSKFDIGGRETWAARQMAEWRERGYVPDSDSEEDEETELNPQPTAVTLPQPQIKDATPHSDAATSATAGTVQRSGGHPNGGHACPKSLGHAAPTQQFIRPQESESGYRDLFDLDRSAECQEPDIESTQLVSSHVEDEEMEAGSLIPSVGDQLQVELNHGLRTIKEILDGPLEHSAAQPTDRSQTSSPLSSIISFADDDEIAFAVQEKPGIGVLVDPGTAGLSHVDELSSFARHQTGRDLRQRNPIQLHPYLLEQARYQQELTARGLKPIRVAQSGTAKHRSPTAYETQNETLFSSSPVDPPPTDESSLDVGRSQASLSVTVPESNPLRQLQRPHRVSYDEEELPELRDILEGNATVFQARKRRRIAYKSSKETSLPLGRDGFNIPDLPTAAKEMEVDDSMDFDIFDLPPSPPRSGSSHGSAGLAMPAQGTEALHVTPKGLPTPIASSVLKPRSTLAVELEQSLGSTQESDPEDFVSTRSPTPETDERRPNGMQNLQRRIKGVLPASWLTLDLDKYGRKRSVRRPSMSPPPTRSMARGVAHRVTKEATRPRAAAEHESYATVISDNSSSDVQPSPVRHGHRTSVPAFFDNEEDSRSFTYADDVMEEDEIDRMVPPLSRRRGNGSGAKQQRIEDSIGRTGKSSPRYHKAILNKNARRKRQSRATDGTERHRKPRQQRSDHQFPQLGILDAPAFIHSQGNIQPQFVRLAARRARARTDKGRQSPARKYFRLASQADTAEVNSELMNWRQGRIIQQTDQQLLTTTRCSIGGHSSKVKEQSSYVDVDVDIDTITSTKIPTQPPDPGNPLSRLQTSTAAIIRRLLSRQAGAPLPVTRSIPRLVSGVAFETSASHSRASTRLSAFQKNRSGRGHLLSSFSFAQEPRPAQVESTSHPRHQNSGLNNLHSGLTTLATSNTDTALTPSRPQNSNQSPFQDRGISASRKLSKLVRNTIARPRKRIPQHLDMASQGPSQRPFLQQSGPQQTASLDIILDRGQPLTQAQNDALQSLEEEALSTPSLAKETFYQDTTFIGGGHLEQTIVRMVEVPRDLSLATGSRATVVNPENSKIHLWAAWNDEVSSQLRTVLEAVFSGLYPLIDGTEATSTLKVASLSSCLRSIIGYINHDLYFDQITDRGLFVTASMDVVHNFLTRTGDDPRTFSGDKAVHMLYALRYLVVFVFQIGHITAGSKIDELSYYSQAWELFGRIARLMLTLTLDDRGRVRIGEFQRTNDHGPEVLKGIGSNWPEVDTIVLLQHLCHQKAGGHTFPGMVNEMLAATHQQQTMAAFEAHIPRVISFFCRLQPLLRFNIDGKYRTDYRRLCGFGCWDIVTHMLKIVLEHSDPKLHDREYRNRLGQRFTVWCVHLTTEWGWAPCDTTILALRTSFLQSRMDDLFGEKSEASPERLFEDCAANYNFTSVREDTGFRSWLKLIILSGQQKARTGARSQLKSFVSTLTPNDGQVLRKSDEATPTKLRRLRNLHDLYSALWLVALPDSKVRLVAQLRALVVPEESHTAAIQVSCLTWSRLVRFEISTNATAMLVFLADWQLTTCHMLLQASVHEEAEFVTFLRQDPHAITDEIREQIRGRMEHNRKQLQNCVSMALDLLENRIYGCTSDGQAKLLLFADGADRLLQFCYPGYGASDKIIATILKILDIYIRKWVHAKNIAESGKLMQQPLRRILSNRLGAPVASNDEVLETLTTCWFALAQKYVKSETRTWDSYLEPGGEDSWYLLPDSSSRRGCMVYFATCLLQNEPEQYQKRQVELLGLWLCALVAPIGEFKYEHLLTTEILHKDLHNPLLLNLPLVTWHNGNEVAVLFDDLVKARVPLIYTIFGNMHKSTTQCDSQELFVYPGQADHSVLLKKMMLAMKGHHQDLASRPQAQQVYDNFVNGVLQQMRLYTEDIQPVDPWFEVSTRFPLALDTVEVKLKAYRAQLVNGVLGKQMCFFLQTAAERSSVSAQQDGFREELLSVLLDLSPSSIQYKDGYAADALFRTLLFQNVFPAYIERMFSTSGFIIGLPILECIVSVYQDLRFLFGFWTVEYLTPFTTSTFCILSSAKHALANLTPEHILNSPQRLCAYTLLLTLLLDVFSRCLEMEEYFGYFGSLPDLEDYFLFFYKHVLSVAFRPPRLLPQALRDDDNNEYYDDDNDLQLPEPQLSAADNRILAYARKELGETLDKKWVCEGGQWFVLRAGGRREPVRGGFVGSIEEETREMQYAGSRYVTAFAAVYNS